MNDMVNHPGHYQLMPGIEVKDIIKSVLGDDEFISYCYGNVIKYILRARKKMALKILKKLVYILIGL